MRYVFTTLLISSNQDTFFFSSLFVSVAVAAAPAAAVVVCVKVLHFYAIHTHYMFTVSHLTLSVVFIEILL